jgi:dTDP-4-dehydrorhamnose 3,5-epimerase-like enzyme
MMEIRLFDLQRHSDDRGYVEENFRPEMLPEGHREFGQCFLTTAKPGIIKGGHRHREKYELFYLVRGQALVTFQDMVSGQKTEVKLSDSKPQVLLIPPGPMHWIKNTGEDDFYLMIYTDKKSMLADIDDRDTYRA